MALSYTVVATVNWLCKVRTAFIIVFLRILIPKRKALLQVKVNATLLRSLQLLFSNKNKKRIILAN
jgi:hypothetical protein